MSRGGFKINRNENDYEFDLGDQTLPSWLESFANNVNKTAVEVARERNDSFFDQISNIMGGNGKSRFATVESVVEDMQKRTGLAEYLNKLQASAEDNKKNRLMAAAEFINSDKNFNENSEIPDAVKKNSDVKSFIDHFVNSKHGKVSKHAVLFELENLFSNSDNIEKKDFQDPNLLTYIQNKIEEILKTSPSFDDYSNMGKSINFESQDKDDSLNNDAFHFANPAK